MSHANPDKKQPEVLGGHVLFEGLAAVEAAARAAFSFIGRGDNKAADHAAVEAMRSVLKTAAMKGRIVIGEGERDEAPMLYIGETVGTGEGEEIDIAVDPLEGTTLTAKAMPNALCVMALSRRGGLLHAPDTYMDKIALGPGWPEGVVDLDASVEENLQAMAKAKGVSVQDLCICFLERPRHADAIEAARGLGARVRLIPDGDVAGIVYTTQPETGVDLYMGRGGAPEGVLAAAALKAIGGRCRRVFISVMKKSVSGPIKQVFRT